MSMSSMISSVVRGLDGPPFMIRSVSNETRRLRNVAYSVDRTVSGRELMLSLPGNNRYDFSAIETRLDYSWPNGKRLAFYVALNIEHFVWGAGRVTDPANRNSPVSTSRN